MKWIVVVLALLNVVAFLLGMKVDPNAHQTASASQFEIINASAMSTIEPIMEKQQEAAATASDGLTLEEDGLAQLKVDKRGQVLMAPTESGKDKDDAKTDPPVILPNNLAKTDTVKAAAQKPVEIAKVAEPEPSSSLEESANVALACYRLGPFNDQKSLASVRRKLENGGIKYTVDERGAPKNIKAVRVYLGAYSNSATLEAETKQLKKMKVEHFVIRLDGTPLVQLGYFSEPARAKAYQKTLKIRGIDAKTDTIYHDTNINSWLDVQLASKDTIGALVLPKNAKFREQTCR
jgi:hypothetical protein